MKPARNLPDTIMVLIFVLSAGLLTGYAMADCFGPPCPFSLPGLNISGCSSCGCGEGLSLCSVGGTCGFNTLPAYIGIMTPGITASPVSGPAPLSVQLQDNSGGAGGTTSWAWDFGDGSSGTGMNPVHIYQTPGNYTVTLTVSRGEKNAYLEWGVSGSTQRTILITVTPGAISQQQAISPAIGQEQPSIGDVYIPPTGFTVPDISKYQAGFSKNTLQSSGIIHTLPKGGVYGY